MAALGAVALAMLALLSAGPAVTQTYAVQPGDILAVEVLEDGSLNREVLVTPDGTFSFPFAGSVQASGRTTAQIAARVQSRIASNFASPPNVFVSVRRLRPEDPRDLLAAQADDAETVEIFLLGEVNAPGPKALPPGVTLLQALSTSGGFTNFAATKRVQLRRTDPHTGRQSVTTVNYRALADGAALRRDIVLVPGDVILVPQRRLFE